MTSHENKAVFRRSESYEERKFEICGLSRASLLQYIVIAKACAAEYGRLIQPHESRLKQNSMSRQRSRGNSTNQNDILPIILWAY